MKRYFIISVLVLVFTIQTQSQITKRERPKEWNNLVEGGRFLDRFLPIPTIGKLSDKTWGSDDVIPRYTDNGIEEKEWSYWGGNILVAFSLNPEGPFEKFHSPLLSKSHEVMLWQEGTGIGVIASQSNTFEYSPDGIDFTTNELNLSVKGRPFAPGVFRQDLTDPSVRGEGLKWGISMVHNGSEAYLIRYEVKKK